MTEVIGVLIQYGAIGAIAIYLIIRDMRRDKQIEKKDEVILSLNSKHEDQILKLGEKHVELAKELAIALKDDDNNEQPGN